MADLESPYAESMNEDDLMYVDHVANGMPFIANIGDSFPCKGCGMGRMRVLTITIEHVLMDAFIHV